MNERTFVGSKSGKYVARPRIARLITLSNKRLLTAGGTFVVPDERSARLSISFAYRSPLRSVVEPVGGRKAHGTELAFTLGPRGGALNEGAAGAT